MSRVRAEAKIEEAQELGLADKVRGAVAWRSGTQIVAQALSWASTLVVIRLLDPSDYGLFAMSQAILVFMTFLSGYGFASALIQSESVEPQRVRQAFGLLLLINGALAGVQVALAPLAADYYGQPLVADMLRWQALLFVATPFCVLPETLLARRLDFRASGIAAIVSTALGAATALALAWWGAGVWALVFAPIVLFWSRALLLVRATRFYVLPSFDFRGAGSMFRFGSALLVGHILWVVQSQADILIAGRSFDAHTLGLYAEALFLTLIFASRFVPPLNQIAFPAYARMQKDPEQLAAAFLTAVRLIMALAVPLYLGLAVAARPAVETLFGPKWVEMAPLVSILALAMPLVTLQILFGPALNALGKPQVTMHTSLAGALIMPATFLVAVRFGPEGLAWGWPIATALLLAVTYRLARPHIAVDAAALARAVLPGLAAGAPMAASVWVLREALPPMAAPAELCILAATGAALYGALLRLAAPELVEEVLRLVVRRRAAA